MLGDRWCGVPVLAPTFHFFFGAGIGAALLLLRRWGAGAGAGNGGGKKGEDLMGHGSAFLLHLARKGGFEEGLSPKWTGEEVRQIATPAMPDSGSVANRFTFSHASLAIYV